MNLKKRKKKKEKEKSDGDCGRKEVISGAGRPFSVGIAWSPPVLSKSGSLLGLRIVQTSMLANKYSPGFLSSSFVHCKLHLPFRRE